jgi:hypothetical protein
MSSTVRPGTVRESRTCGQSGVCALRCCGGRRRFLASTGVSWCCLAMMRCQRSRLSTAGTVYGGKTVYGATNVGGATRRRQTLATGEQQDSTEGGCSLLLLAHTWALHIPGRHPCRPFLIGPSCRRPLPPAFICPTRAATEPSPNTS